MKYIMVEGKNSAGIVQKVPFIFPDFLIHKFVADVAIMMLSRRHDFEGAKVVSAGEIIMKVTATVGSSETCKVSANLSDEAIINQYNYGIEE